MRTYLLATFAVAAIWAAPASADTAEARCDIYPAKSDQLTKMIHCTFSQRQDFVTITREDGVIHELTQMDDTPGDFKDQHGQTVYRQSGLGDQGLIFRFPDQSVFVHWSTAGLDRDDSDNSAAPFSTAEFDATTDLRCGKVGTSAMGSCPAGIVRMEAGQASITVQNQKGEQFTINFMTGYVNATNNKQADATLNGDTWIVTIDGEEVYEVPLAAIEGG